jgi:hypothetical protein
MDTQSSPAGNYNHFSCYYVGNLIPHLYRAHQYSAFHAPRCAISERNNDMGGILQRSEECRYRTRRGLEIKPGEFQAAQSNYAIDPELGIHLRRHSYSFYYRKQETPRTRLH